MKQVRNVGMNKGTPRLWLEGNALEASGFIAGSFYDLSFTDDTITLTLRDGALFKVSGHNKGGKRKAVIDLHSSKLATFLRGATQVTVQYLAGRIVITR